MTGLDCLGVDDTELGVFNYMSLLSGAGGMLSGGGGGKDSGAAAAEKARLEDDRRRAEQSASTMKMVLIGLVALVGAGGIALLAGRRK